MVVVVGVEAASHDPIQMLELRRSTEGALRGELGPECVQDSGVVAAYFLLLVSSFL